MSTKQAVMNALCVLVLSCYCVAKSDQFSVGSKLADRAPALLIPGIAGSALRDVSTPRLDPREWIDFERLISTRFDNIRATFSNGHVTSNLSLTPYPGLSGVQDIAGYVGSIDSRALQEFRDLIRVLSLVDAAPYDWRLVPQKDDLEAWVALAKKKVEDLYFPTKTKVYLIAHSMGNLMATYLMNTNVSWTSQYVAGYLAVAPPFGGAGVAYQRLLSGWEFIHDRITLAVDVIAPFPSVSWLFPTTWCWGDTVLLEVGSSNYTAATAPLYIGSATVLGRTTILPIYQQIVQTLPDFLSNPPPVPVWLITGEIDTTAIGVSYDNTDFRVPKPIYDTAHLADGTVPYKSAHALDLKWKIDARQMLAIHANHADIISDLCFIKNVNSILAGGGVLACA